MAMNKTFAVCGKGGAGKTVFSALLARAMIDKKDTGKLLLIDADPALGLANALGITVEKTIGQVREAIIETARSGDESDKIEMAGRLDYMLLESLIEGEDYSLLAMGRSESLGCFCSVNNLLRDAIKMLSENFNTILVDGEAGLEQLNRQVMDRLDCLIVLTDGSARGLKTACLLKKMVKDDNIVECGKIGIVFNRTDGNEDYLLRSASGIGMEVFGFVPPDTDVANYDIQGLALTGLSSVNPAVSAVNTILSKLIKA